MSDVGGLRRTTGQTARIGPRLPDAVSALPRAPALIPKVLALRLKIAPQTGTPLLREMEANAGSGRDGWGSCRAVAV